MKTFSYEVVSENGIHARPAGLLVKLCGEYASAVELAVNGKTASARKLFALMNLGAQQGDTIHVRVDGIDEAEAAEAIRELLSRTL